MITLCFQSFFYQIFHWIIQELNFNFIKGFADMKIFMKLSNAIKISL